MNAVSVRFSDRNSRSCRERVWSLVREGLRGFEAGGASESPSAPPLRVGRRETPRAMPASRRPHTHARTHASTHAHTHTLARAHTHTHGRCRRDSTGKRALCAALRWVGLCRPAAALPGAPRRPSRSRRDGSVGTRKGRDSRLRKVGSVETRKGRDSEMSRLGKGAVGSPGPARVAAGPGPPPPPFLISLPPCLPPAFRRALQRGV